MNWLGLLPYALAAVIAAGATWPLARAPLQGEIANLRKAYAGLREANAESVRLATLAVAARLQTAQAAGEEASAKLATTLAQNDQLTREKRDALKAATTGRACLSGRAVRVLNGTTGSTHGAAGAGVPAASGEPVAEGGAVATDSDVGGWIAGAIEQHDACRAQLDALIDWHAQQQAGEGSR
jgi:hypothetical protein